MASDEDSADEADTAGASTGSILTSTLVIDPVVLTTLRSR